MLPYLFNQMSSGQQNMLDHTTQRNWKLTAWGTFTRQCPQCLTFSIVYSEYPSSFLPLPGFISQLGIIYSNSLLSSLCIVQAAFVLVTSFFIYIYIYISIYLYIKDRDTQKEKNQNEKAGVAFCSLNISKYLTEIGNV